MHALSYVIVGGDLRQIGVANALICKGRETYVYKTPPCNNIDPKIKNAALHHIREASAVLLPMPCSKDDVTLYCSAEENILLSELFSFIHPKCRVYGGRVSSAVQNLAKLHGFCITDYAKMPDFAVKNGAVTAEGAIQLAMQHALRCIRGQRVLVIGFGNIAKPLTMLLKSLGASVTVAARRSEAQAESEQYGALAVSCVGLKQSSLSYDIIFNTVPEQLLSAQQLQPNTLYIELASKPYGADFGY